MAFTISSSVLLYSKPPKSRLSTSVPQLGVILFSPWNGLRHLGISIRQKSVKIERKGRCKGKVVYASLFGVGAPEALVVGVVALLVFGPKGLAEVARNLGKSLRAFQPTIRELQEVSREFKSTLEREIGLNDIPPSTQNTNRSTTTNTPTLTTSSSYANNENFQAVTDPNGAPPTNRPYNNIGEFLAEAQLKSSASQQQESTLPREEESKPQLQPQATAPEVAATMLPPKLPESET